METSLRSGASFSLAKKPVKCTLKSRKLSIELQFLKALVIKSDDFFAKVNIICIVIMARYTALKGQYFSYHPARNPCQDISIFRKEHSLLEISILV